MGFTLRNEIFPAEVRPERGVQYISIMRQHRKSLSDRFVLLQYIFLIKLLVQNDPEKCLKNEISRSLLHFLRIIVNMPKK